MKRAKENYGITLTIDETVKAHIAEKGHDTKYGARPLKRAIREDLEDYLAEAILSGQIKSGSNIVITYNSDRGYHYGER